MQRSVGLHGGVGREGFDHLFFGAFVKRRTEDSLFLFSRHICKEHKLHGFPPSFCQSAACQQRCKPLCVFGPPSPTFSGPISGLPTAILKLCSLSLVGGHGLQIELNLIPRSTTNGAASAHPCPCQKSTLGLVCGKKGLSQYVTSAPIGCAAHRLVPPAWIRGLRGAGPCRFPENLCPFGLTPPLTEPYSWEPGSR
jgi:hypothetical protein